MSEGFGVEDVARAFDVPVEMLRPEVDVYLTGWLLAIRSSWRAARSGHWEHARYSLWSEWRDLVCAVREGRWRVLRQGFNGWMAEPHYLPDGLTRCGTGWTRRRAERDLYRQARRDGVTLR